MMELFRLYDRKDTLPYHNLSHILDCVSFITHNQTVNPLVTDEIKLALVYHDVIYDPTATDNEEKSAYFTKNHLKDLFVTDMGTLEKICYMIIQTKHGVFNTDNLDTDTKVVLDTDLSILASDEVEYLQYSENIREEYAHIDDDSFYKGRREFLEKMLAKRKIYQLCVELEPLARKNIENEILHISRKF